MPFIQNDDPKSSMFVKMPRRCHGKSDRIRMIEKVRDSQKCKNDWKEENFVLSKVMNQDQNVLHVALH